MIAQLKELSSYEIDEDLASYTPEVFDNFELTILASIGVNGTEGLTSFSSRFVLQNLYLTDAKGEWLWQGEASSL